MVKILAAFLSSLFALLYISVDLPGFSDERIAVTSIEYKNDDAGNMDAVISITTTADGETLEIFDIPDNKRADRGEKIYSFGSISDLHFNRYENEDGSDVAEKNICAFT